MTEKFRIGDHVIWNSEAGQVRGTIKAIHTRDFDYKAIGDALPRKTHNMKSRAIRPTMSRLTKVEP